MENKAVIITGASSGLGAEFAKQFAKRKFDIVLTARSENKLKELAQQLESSYGIKAYTVPLDLSQSGSAMKLYETVASLGVTADILINNAGFGLFGEFEETEMQKELDMIEVNITALTELTKYFGKDMVSRKSGKILNVASTAAFQPGPLMAVYYATKAYVLSLSEALANEWEGNGVKVAALCPGATETGFSSTAELSQSKLFQSGVMKADEVVEQAVNSLLETNKTVIIPGFKNKMLASSVRFMPRKMVPSIVRKVQERI
ncbi:SDR family oxidoreductase [Bacillus salacetis]|uniref:SDR family oxidoreductase n=1 Tax=Bacillus salacetis TaxID=2315464 RepID=A0A3A1R6P6_9BACI|nr:SDR family oxidoreductase [Bacillus salacetis]RIW38898.1 SDR family oxidoreductase [Bacillus salacetis]